LWRYTDAQGRLLCCTARFDLAGGSKVILPLCYGQNGGNPHWHWKSLPEPRPLYGLERLAAMPDAPVLLVEGEKAADAAQALFQHHAVLTWSGGANAVAKADLLPLSGRKIIIWPDNDQPGFKAALLLAEKLTPQTNVGLIMPPPFLPEKWDLADKPPSGFIPQDHLKTALSVSEFRRQTLEHCSGYAGKGRQAHCRPESPT
jgi:hypothetical protein